MGRPFHSSKCIKRKVDSLRPISFSWRQNPTYKQSAISLSLAPFNGETHQVNLIKSKLPLSPILRHLRPRRPFDTRLPPVLEPILHLPIQHQLSRIVPIPKDLVDSVSPALDDIPHALAHG